MLISRRGYNWNNVLSPNGWAYNRDFTILSDYERSPICVRKSRPCFNEDFAKQPGVFPPSVPAIFFCECPDGATSQSEHSTVTKRANQRRVFNPRGTKPTWAKGLTWRGLPKNFHSSGEDK